jgi:hypothetical protein
MFRVLASNIRYIEMLKALVSFILLNAVGGDTTHGRTFWCTAPLNGRGGNYDADDV